MSRARSDSMAVNGTPMSNSSRGKTKSSEATRRIRTKMGAAQGGPQQPQEGEEPTEGDNNPHNPENARRRGAEALRGLIISEQIKQSIQGGTANESTT